MSQSTYATDNQSKCALKGFRAGHGGKEPPNANCAGNVKCKKRFTPVETVSVHLHINIH